MPITLYTTPLSPPGRAVLITAEALGLKINLKEVDLLKEAHLTEEFQKLNPQHTIPVLDDTGTIIWDSHAIITYLVRKYAKDDSLYPRDFAKRALVDQRLHFEGSVVFVGLKQIVRGARQGIKPVTSALLEHVYESYDFLNTFLKGIKYAAGNSVTVADISLISSISSLNTFIPIESNKYPNLVRWIKDVEILPYYHVNKPGLQSFKTCIDQLLSL